MADTSVLQENFLTVNGAADALTAVDMNAVANRISRERLSKYLFRCGNDIPTALKLYIWNHEVGAALNMLLQQFEICLRNAIATTLLDVYGPSWFTRHKLIGSNADIAGEIAKAKARAEENLRGNPVTSDDFIAAAMFGLWRELCKPLYAGLFWGKKIHLSFPHHEKAAEKGQERVILAEVHRRVDLLLKLRNRIAHHEPIIGNNRDPIGVKLSDRHSDLYEVMNWMDPNFAQWMKGLDRFEAMLKDCPLP